ncbi:hypothetical protein [Comamonas testosteroni]|uniref:hypothetical protein n=1 Tax=Comamonas testosteroni TaxID=285 RepID=UPI0026ED0418|nr:hypothetical protein [Comamonas testosteroni]WQD41446.1 hypothetical protein U0024_16910 [Comamonas testosteroni]
MNMHPDAPSGDDKPDALREIYHDAVAQDRGPSAQSSAAILDRARQRAAGVGQEPSEPMDKPAANDRFWLRHALGGLAAVGLVGWLMLQHGAWWSGPDAGSGSSSEVVAEPAQPAQPADIDPAAQAAVQASAMASAPAAADASAAPSAPLAEKSRQSGAPAKAQQVPHTLDVQASAPAPQSEAAPASSAATGATASRAPAAKALSRSTDAAQPVAPAADAVAPQNSRLSAQLPLCPLQTEEEARRQAATEGADKGADRGSGTARRSPHCRPRKPEQLPPVKSGSGPDAAQDVATPQR